MEDWAEVHRLFHREGLTKAAIARRLGMSRNDRGPAARAAPSRRDTGGHRRGSLVDPFADEIAAMLETEADAPATVILERLRRSGYAGGISILKDHLARVRPAFLAARAFQRTTYLPGEIGQLDWWHTGVHGAGRPWHEPRGLRPRAHPAPLGCPCDGLHARADGRRTCAWPSSAASSASGGVPERIVHDNDASIVAARRGKPGPAPPRGAAPCSDSCARRPCRSHRGRPTSKGQVERTIGYLETSFLPLRTFTSLADLQAQHDAWAAEVAFARTLRRTGARVGDRFAVERGFLHRLPEPLPDTDLRLEARAGKDAFVRVLGADYSVPPAFVGRRIGIRVSPTEVELVLRGARHRRAPAQLRAGRRRARPRARPGHPPRA